MVNKCFKYIPARKGLHRTAFRSPLNIGYMDSPCGQATPFESEAVLDCSSTFGLFVGTVARARMMMRVSDNLIR